MTAEEPRSLRREQFHSYDPERLKTIPGVDREMAARLPAEIDAAHHSAIELHRLVDELKEVRREQHAQFGGKKRDVKRRIKLGAAPVRNEAALEVLRVQEQDAFYHRKKKLRDQIAKEQRNGISRGTLRNTKNVSMACVRYEMWMHREPARSRAGTYRSTCVPVACARPRRALCRAPASSRAHVMTDVSCG